MLRYADRYRDKIEYEMDFWVKNGMRMGVSKYIKYLQEFGLDVDSFSEMSIADVGCGPFGGITHVALDTYTLAVAVDPLFPDYEKANILKLGSEVFRLDLAAEELDCNGLVGMDYVFSCNALDHSPDEHTDNTNEAVRCMLSLLKPGGKFCLYVHLRSENELDYGHDFAMTPEKIKTAVAKAEADLLGYSFEYLRWEIKDRDAINNGKCKTAVAIIQRRSSDDITTGAGQ